MKYVLFALLIIGPVGNRNDLGRESTWTAEFSSEQKCREAGEALSHKFSYQLNKYLVIVDYICVGK